MKNQRQRILEWLKKNRAITTKGAIENLGVLRASERIRELIAEGHDIARERVIVHNKYGEPCKVARYRLVKAATQ